MALIIAGIVTDRETERLVSIVHISVLVDLMGKTNKRDEKMKVTVKIPREIDITHVDVDIAVRYGEEDIPKDFPMRRGDTWQAVIDIDSGTIRGWPEGKSGRVDMKVCDEGIYTLYDSENRKVKEIDGYVPNNLIPGEWGDSVDLQIDETGKITNWPEEPNLNDFFGVED